jgi:DNA-nicking Smr family endonuclease
VNFGDILDEWDRETAKPRGKKAIDAERRRAEKRVPGETDEKAGSRPEPPRANPMDVWLRRYGIQDKDEALDQLEKAESPQEERRRLRAMRPDATCDLHGLTREDAWARLESFFSDCHRRGLRKALIIHGKGNHSAEDPVLRQMVKLFLERCPYAGESGTSTLEMGGSGSTWVIVK